MAPVMSTVGFTAPTYAARCLPNCAATPMAENRITDATADDLIGELFSWQPPVTG